MDADDGDCGIQMAGWKPEVEITSERKEMTTRFSAATHIFDHDRTDMPLTT